MNALQLIWTFQPEGSTHFIIWMHYLLRLCSSEYGKYKVFHSNRPASSSCHDIIMELNWRWLDLNAFKRITSPFGVYAKTSIKLFYFFFKVFGEPTSTCEFRMIWKICFVVPNTYMYCPLYGWRIFDSGSLENHQHERQHHPIYLSPEKSLITKVWRP